jgi:ubiquinone/menaquinone biosynthesis C-methylase UbiE
VSDLSPGTAWQERETAREWDAGGGARLPTRVEQQEILLTLLREAQVGHRVVLDLGVGSGLVAEAVLEALPEASLVGIDFSEAMLDLARVRLARFGPRVRLLRHDLAELGELVPPTGRYAAALSVQTLHHLSDADKEAAIAWSARVVETGGLIVIVDRVAVPESLFSGWAALWRRIDPATPASYAEYEEQLALAGDHPASVHDQLSWLRKAGLDAMCVHAYGHRVVLAGRKTGSAG